MASDFIIGEESVGVMHSGCYAHFGEALTRTGKTVQARKNGTAAGSSRWWLVMSMLTSIAALMFAARLLATQGASGSTVWDGVFTETQALRGEAAYGRSCAACHKEDLLGSGTAPAVAGEEFFRRWNESTLDDVVQTMKSSMPQDAPDSLAAQVYVDIVTYLLKASGSPTGSEELTANRDRLKLVRITPPPAR